MGRQTRINKCFYYSCLLLSMLKCFILIWFIKTLCCEVVLFSYYYSFIWTLILRVSEVGRVALPPSSSLIIVVSRLNWNAVLTFLLRFQLTPSPSSPPLDTWLIPPSLCRSFPSAADPSPPWWCHGRLSPRLPPFSAGCQTVELNCGETFKQTLGIFFCLIFCLCSKRSTEDYSFLR